MPSGVYELNLTICWTAYENCKKKKRDFFFY